MKKINNFFVKVESQTFYKKLFKEPLTYVAGAVLLSILQIIHFSLLKDIWGVTTAFTYWGAFVFEKLGANVDAWGFIPQVNSSYDYIFSGESLLNIGIILGALLAALLASQFKIKKIKSFKQIVSAILGGLFMGYGARLALGCNIGALYSAISAFSLSGWVFAIFVFLGAFIGSKMLLKFFM